MPKEIKRELLILLFFIAAAAASFSFARPGSNGELISSAGTINDQLAGVFAQLPPDAALAARTQAQGCQTAGPLPDPECTPGAVFSDATLQQICVSDYTKTVRSVSTSLKKRVYASYGMTYPQPRGAYEVDHLVPLAIGGSNDVANLFPEAGEPRPGFREKDVVEVYLRDAVCSGQINLAAAQYRIATDWVSIYERLTPRERRCISEKYHNTWAGDPDFGSE